MENNNKFLEKLTKDIPEIISSSIKMNEANEVIPVYKGIFQLVYLEKQINVEGEINFAWFPDKGVVFSGTVQGKTIYINNLLNSTEEFKLLIDGLLFGDCFITKTVIENNFKIEGILKNSAIRGDKSIPVSSVKFTIPNLRDFLGLPVKMDSSGTRISKSRLIFENNDYIIIIDRINSDERLIESLRYKGGYAILYNGEITKKKGNIKFDELREVLYCFSTFLSFLNGRRCSPLFKQGIFENEIKWTDYTSYSVAPYKYVISWPRKYHIEGLNELWQKFSEIWKNENDKDFLLSIIRWYLESNSYSGHTEGSIIMAQAGLELIYNWLLIEQNKLLVGKDAENITASNKIRLLLSYLTINSDFPTSFKNLKSVPKVIDAPDAFVQIRNAIVHSQEDKRKKFTKMHYKVNYEALHLGIWYMELALLKILDFKGGYHNRTSKGMHEIQCEQYLPWIKGEIVS